MVAKWQAAGRHACRLKVCICCRLPAYDGVWSPSGKLLAVMASPKVLVLDGKTRKQLAALECPETKAVAFSASDKLLQTHQTPHKVNGASAPNLKVCPQEC